jgi:NAD(P)-dependent dehydrogenase (short-subunit alcohol dehydrogenase family)
VTAGGQGRLAGKVALITGAGSGIGREAAVRFAREGARVVVLDRAEDLGKGTEQLVADAGGEALFVACDVTEPDSVASAVAAGVARFGQLDVVYNNAGGSTANDGAVHEVPLDEWWRTLNVDLFGTFLVSRFAVPHLLERGGSVINTTSAAGLMGVDPGRSAYSAAKGGVIALTRAMAATYARHGIRVNALAPGGTATDRIKDAFARTGRELPTEGPGIPAIGQPHDIANAALFLASDEARMVTGQVLAVDGGSTTTRTLGGGR